MAYCEISKQITAVSINALLAPAQASAWIESKLVNFFDGAYYGTDGSS